MRKTRRVLPLIVALCLCAALAVSALAEGVLGTLYRAGTGLLFDTDNATITAHADFVYNGLPFKTLDARYLQDGVNSQLELKLKTPRGDGSMGESGFTVVGNGDTAYAIDPVDNPYVYHTSSMQASSSILSSNTLSRALIRLGALVVDASESSFADLITVTAGENATQYHVQLREGQTPALVNVAGTVMAQLAAERYFYMDYGYYGYQPQAEETASREVQIAYDDYNATFAAFYQRLYGDKLPEDFYDQLWGEDEEAAARAGEQYQAVQDAMYDDLTVTIRDTYAGGVALIKGDGDIDYYETIDEYYVKNNLQMVDFADFDATYRAYYQKTTGQELAADTLEALYYTNNGALIEAYEKIYDQMMDTYMDLVQQDGKAALIYVNADGSYRMIYDYEAYVNSQNVIGATVTRRILYSLDSLEIGDTDFVLTTDDQNRIAAAQGSLELVVIDPQGFRNKLEITFDAAVTQYGETQVSAFDPQAFGVMSWEEFQQADAGLLTPQTDPEEEFALPETVVFDGVQYQLILEDDMEEQE